MKTRYIDSNLIVSNILDSTALTAGFRLGDIIESVDGNTVDTYFNEFATYTAHSIKSVLIDLYATGYLSTNNRFANVKLRRNDTLKQIRFDVLKLSRLYDENASDVPAIARNGYTFINDSIGYIYPGTMTFDKEDTTMVKFKNTKGIIIDMRCYPKEFFWRTPRHFIADSITTALFQKPDYQLPGSFFYKVLNGELFQNNLQKKDITYKGKIIILVNGNTISQAEHLTMWLQSVPGSVTIGSQTAGCDGDIVYMPLPYKGLGFYFSSLGVVYPDGTPTQRIGVKIDRIVKPTPQGLRESRDEVLEEAIKIIQQENSAPLELM